MTLDDETPDSWELQSQTDDARAAQAAQARAFERRLGERCAAEGHQLWTGALWLMSAPACARCGTDLTPADIARLPQADRARIAARPDRAAALREGA